RGPNSPPEPPYDVTAWSLGMLLGVDTTFATGAIANLKLTKLDAVSTGSGQSVPAAGDVSGSGTRFAFDYKGADTAIAINRLLKDGARVAFDAPSHLVVTGAPRGKMEQLARDFGLSVQVSAEPRTQNQRTRTRNPQNRNPQNQNPQNQNPQNQN